MLTLEDLENESIKKLDGPLPSAPEALAVEASVSPPAFCVQLDGPLPSAPEALAVEAAVSPPAFCVRRWQRRPRCPLLHSVCGAGSGGCGVTSCILCAVGWPVTICAGGAGSGGRGVTSRILCARPRSRLRYLSFYGLVTV